MSNPKIVARGKPKMVDMTVEVGGTVTLSFGMWCTTDTGQSYVRYIDITPTDKNANISGPNRVWPKDVQDVLDRAQANFEKDPSAYGRPVSSPEEEIDRVSKESSGMEQAGHEGSPKDWQQVSDWAADPSGERKERAHDYSGALCWCGGRGVHAVGISR